MVVAPAPQPGLSQPSSSPQGQVLRGQYTGPMRSAKGKLKGLILHAAEGEVAVKLPKYLRPMLVRELQPGAWVQVWAYRDDDRWRGLNLIPWPETEVPQALKDALAEAATVARKAVETNGKTCPKPAATKPACIQVCRKGKCFRQGGQHILQALQGEVEGNPDLRHITVEGTGCMGACKQGPNLRVMPQKKMHSRVTPDRAIALLAHVQ